MTARLVREYGKRKKSRGIYCFKTRASWLAVMLEVARHCGEFKLAWLRTRRGNDASSHFGGGLMRLEFVVAEVR